MIYTINFNPALDHYLTFDNFQEDKLNTPNLDYKLPGGKGINVSKILKNYSINSTCLGFLGGFTGDFIETKIKEYGILSNFIKIKEDSRINIKINNNGIETEISGIAPKISQEKYTEFLNLLKSTIKDEDIIVLSGSLPKSLTQNAYGDIIDSIPSSTKVILDTRGQAFLSAIKKGVFLVKPNIHELEEFFNKKFNSLEEIITSGKELQKMGATNVIISMGKEGSIFLTQDNIYIGNVPKGTLISSVGAGDSMVGGFIYGLSKQFSLEETYKFAIASGSATAFSQGLAKYETTLNLLSDITIKKYEVNR